MSKPVKSDEIPNERKRPASSAAAPISADQSSNKMIKIDRAYKGLRQFSMVVCKKVEEKGKTTYSEVADELVSAVVEEKRRESTNTENNVDKKYDEKNIRRRVYDALNVLMAVDIISKDKKEIFWNGIPTTSTQYNIETLHREIQYKQSEIQRKRVILKELLIQQVCFRNLVERNLKYDKEYAKKKQNYEQQKDNKIPLPFIVVNTSSNAVIQCNMSRDLTDVMFDFTMPFEINDDNTILKRLGLDKTNQKVLKEMLPEDMYQYCMQHNLLDEILSSSPTSDTTTPSP